MVTTVMFNGLCVYISETGSVKKYTAPRC